MLAARDIDVTIGAAPILRGVSLTVAPGEVVAVLGPNGAGKSTLLRVMSGSLQPTGGSVSFEGRPLSDWPRQDLARRRSVLPQNPSLTFPFRAADVVQLGRSPHAGLTSRDEDLAIVDRALAETEVAHLSERDYTSLSGGEQQRVHMARVLAQIWPDGGSAGPRYLLLDEPTASLDLAHQHETLRIARRFAERGTGVVAILHDLNLAAMHADRLCVLKDGAVAAEGPPDDVLTEAAIAAVFNLPVSVTRHPTRNCPHVIPA